MTLDFGGGLDEVLLERTINSDVDTDVGLCKVMSSVYRFIFDKEVCASGTGISSLIGNTKGSSVTKVGKGYCSMKEFQ